MSSIPDKGLFITQTLNTKNGRYIAPIAACVCTIRRESTRAESAGLLSRPTMKERTIVGGGGGGVLVDPAGVSCYFDPGAEFRGGEGAIEAGRRLLMSRITKKESEVGVKLCYR